MAGRCVSHRLVRAHRSLLLRMSCLPRPLSVLCATLFVNAAFSSFCCHASGPRVSVQSSFSFIGLANSPLGFFHNILWKNAKEFFDQLNSFHLLSIWASVSQRASHLIRHLIAALFPPLDGESLSSSRPLISVWVVPDIVPST